MLDRLLLDHSRNAYGTHSLKESRLAKQHRLTPLLPSGRPIRGLSLTQLERVVAHLDANIKARFDRVKYLALEHEKEVLRMYHGAYRITNFHYPFDPVVCSLAEAEDLVRQAAE